MINFEYLVESAVLDEDSVFDWLKTVIEKEHQECGPLSIILGSDEWLLTYNKRFLEHDFYTDIITFDYSDELLLSGDLLISYERVVENANRMNVSRETELYRVIVHGVLHLCGYKDELPSEKEIMRNKEDYYLKLL